MGEATGRVKLIEGIQMLGESGSGHTLVMDAAESVGGRNMGIRPMELLLLGLGGCTAIDVLNILRKGRHDVRDCEILLKGHRPEDQQPSVFDDITLHYVVTGKGLPEKAVARAIKLSKESYCSASAMLEKTAKISTSFEIRDIDA